MFITKTLMLAAAFQAVTPSVTLSPARSDDRTQQTSSFEKSDECTQAELQEFSTPGSAGIMAGLPHLGQPGWAALAIGGTVAIVATGGAAAVQLANVKAAGKSSKAYEEAYQVLQQKECAQWKRQAASNKGHVSQGRGTVRGGKKGH